MKFVLRIGEEKEEGRGLLLRSTAADRCSAQSYAHKKQREETARFGFETYIGQSYYLVGGA